MSTAAVPAHIVEIAIPLYLDKNFHYLVPEQLSSCELDGKRALVPFGNRTLTGYILGRCTPPDTGGTLKEFIELLDQEPLWTPGELEFFRWVAAYYQHPLGEVLRTALPGGINISSRTTADKTASELSSSTTIRYETFYLPAIPEPASQQPGSKAREILSVIREAGEISAGELRNRFGSCSPQLKRLCELGLCTAQQREQYRDPFKNSTVLRDTPPRLQLYQNKAFAAIAAVLDQRLYNPFLLHGVTGSGKTEVYLHAIAHALAQGRSALVLVPEIALTPQLTSRFQARFGTGIAILHSGLSGGERYDEWRRIRRGQAQIVIGARSAIFAPLEHIGIIIVDEEHEASFKQSDGLRYNARDLALVRGRFENAAVVLGSATPLVTSMYASQQGRLQLLELPERVESRPMPTVALVAMKGVKSALSPQLAEALKENYVAGRQAIVFLNRRGFATYLVCADCNQPLICPNCSVTLTYHRQRRQSICHYCDFAVPMPGICPSCDGASLIELGVGTEKLEHDLRELLPEARVVRMDSDTTSGKGSHERLLARMNDGSADILAGTQMIAKGHDFPGVTLVGVVSAEGSLGMPDFRASERTFQLLSQVIGRAGRGELPGTVVVQAYDPHHFAIQAAANHQSAEFYQQELEFRHDAGYPPFTFLAAFAISGLSEETVTAQAAETARLLSRLKAELKIRVDILGPAPAPLYRLRNRYRQQILLKAQHRSQLHSLIRQWRLNAQPPSTIRISVDIDPLDLM